MQEDINLTECLFVPINKKNRLNIGSKEEDQVHEVQNDGLQQVRDRRFYINFIY